MSLVPEQLPRGSPARKLNARSFREHVRRRVGWSKSAHKPYDAHTLPKKFEGFLGGAGRNIHNPVFGHPCATVDGYVAVLEAVGETTPIHSCKRRTRGSKFVVAAEVADRIRAERFTGLKVTPVGSTFPGDEPL